MNVRRSLNLMTDEAVRDGILRGARRFWLRTLALTLLALVVMGGLEWQRGRSTSQRLATLESDYTPIETQKAESAAMRVQINSLRSAQQLTLQLVDTRPIVTLLGAISSAAQGSGGQVYVEKLEFIRQDGAASQQQLATLTGGGQTNSAIAGFAAALRASELFQQVTLNSSDSSRQTTSDSRSFRLECQL